MSIYKQNLSIHHQQYLLWLMTWTNDLLTLILWLKFKNNISPCQETTWVSQVNELCLLFATCTGDDWVKLKSLCKNLSFESFFSLLSIVVFLSIISWLLLLLIYMNLNVLFTCILITTKLLFSTLLDYNFCFIHLYLWFEIVK